MLKSNRAIEAYLALIRGNYSSDWRFRLHSVQSSEHETMVWAGEDSLLQAHVAQILSTPTPNTQCCDGGWHIAEIVLNPCGMVEIYSAERLREYGICAVEKPKPVAHG